MIKMLLKNTDFVVPKNKNVVLPQSDLNKVQAVFKFRRKYA